jgi:hypothetical protein
MPFLKARPSAHHLGVIYANGNPKSEVPVGPKFFRAFRAGISKQVWFENEKTSTCVIALALTW